MEVEGSIVEVRPIDLEIQYTYSDGSPNYRQRSLYEVFVDDVKRGYIYFPKGYGGKWHVLALRPQQGYSPSYNKQDDEAKTRFGIAHYYKHLSPGALNEKEDWGEHARDWEDRNAILRAFPRMVALGRCPSPAEEIENHEAEKVKHAERVATDAANKIRWAEERAQQQAAEEARKQRAEEERIESLEGLTSIRDRLGAQLSNFEMVALTRAIEKVTR